MLGKATDRIDACKALRILEQWRDDPVLGRPQIGRLVSVVGQPFAFWRNVAPIGLHAGFAGLMLVILAVLQPDGPHIDLAQPRRDRPHRQLDTRRQLILHLPQPLVHERARPINIRTVLEHDSDLAEPVS